MCKRFRAPLTSALVLAALLVTINEASAQTLPSPWTGGDVGAPLLSGSAGYDAGVFTIDAAGSDIWGTSDQFHFVWQKVAGDAEIIARVDSVTAAHAWSKAGVMIRRSLAANSAHGYVLVSAGKGVNFQRRATNGASSASTLASASTPPAWVRAVRQGSTVSSYWSTDGTTWTLISQQAVALDVSAYYGIAVTSHNANQRTTAQVSNVSIIPKGLPAGQQSADIGNPPIAGSASYADGTYTVQASGADIWGTADQFHYLFQPMTGDGEVVTRVASVQRTTTWSKAGVMMRESLSADSRHAMMVVSASKGYAFQRRPETGGLSVHTAGSTGAAPGWVRLVRRGDLFEAYESTDGAAWTRVGSDTITMGSTIYVGLAVTSHSTSATTTARLDNLSITSTAPPANQPPAVSITGPANGTHFTAPATVTVTATATDPENRMASVDFYADSTLIGSDTTSPYSVSWSSSTAGTYVLTAVAHDADGGSTTSAAVSVTIDSANQPPTASLTSPANGASFSAPATINLAASAADPEGQLARVEFYAGTTLLGTDTAAPYAFSWGNVPAGTYSLTAKAYDGAGATATSAAVMVTVNPPNGAPTVSLTSPANGATFTAPATVSFAANAADPEGQLTRVEFYSGTTLLGSDTTSPYTFSWSNVAAGTYSLTARAYDAGGLSSTSAAVSITVNPSTTIPAPWTAADVGSPALSGSASYSSGAFTINASGNDIWSTSDQFHFVYQPIAGDVQITARVDSQTVTNEWANSGVMIRTSLAANSAFAYMASTAQHGIYFRRRTGDGATATSTAGPASAPPVWVRLVRVGSVVTSYGSLDGTNWTQTASVTLAFGSTAYVGLAVTAHDVTVRSTAVISNVAVAAPANQPPAVSLTSPANGASFVAPATISIAANASDPENQLARVEFYSGTTLLGTDTAAPYSFSWTNVAAGTYTLTARAYDTAGAQATSAAVTVTVTTTSTPPRLVVFTASADHATNVTSYRFDVFNAGANPDTATPVAAADLGKPAPDANNDITSDQSTLFSNLAVGNYIATVTAIGPGGSTRSAAVAFTR